ncbi:adenosylcobinamide-phosphate synthase [Spinactinospora alkalitolerans]|uniref:Cobalamin biosynthesis protein CobD n=1 Tax=Spinactinospora alkalitolerans TaxID=687207 RepID=A0A852TRT1_9ACTN|nr:cobalamin biosynthesis protein [Spinactinospora alkalitolerans]NYE46255.1 adenosylcobinamide-phosphate synthase [Spinactinospora alkalitolerans]
MQTQRHPTQTSWPLALGLLAGAALDRVLPDPERGHPVALFGRAAGSLERSLHAPSRARGAAFTVLAVLPVAALGAAGQRDARPWRRAALTGAATWAVVGGAMLGREADRMADALEAGDLAAARRRLPHLCGRDPSTLDADGLARATVESVAENTSDAVVAPLMWGALLGLPGLLGYRAVNTLDAMVGHRSERYERFGWAAARLDDVANWAPARLTAVLAAAAAPVVSGSPLAAWRIRGRYGRRHPSPNAGQCEAAFAGALGLRLGGANVYGGRVEHRPELGEGRGPRVRDIRRAVRLARTVNAAAAVLAAAAAWIPARRPGSRG